jgi:hypothetical protein
MPDAPAPWPGLAGGSVSADEWLPGARHAVPEIRWDQTVRKLVGLAAPSSVSRTDIDVDKPAVSVEVCIDEDV